jgi:hypothetical protein
MRTEMNIFFEEIDKVVFECIDATAKGYGRNCARNAVSHLETAWNIKDIDPEMAVFRAITAEEEAATAIFIALKEKGYENANRIKFKSHPYKQAVAPFVTAISKFMADVAKWPSFPLGKKYQLSMEGEGKDRKLILSFYLADRLATPIPPLGFEIALNGKPYYFEKELLEITSGKGRADIMKYVQDIANLRNSILYARSEGIPKITGKIDGHLEKRRRTVIIFLRIYSLIYPYNEKALFVEQALKAFLVMMGEIEDVVEEQHN